MRFFCSTAWSWFWESSIHLTVMPAHAAGWEWIYMLGFLLCCWFFVFFFFFNNWRFKFLSQVDVTIGPVILENVNHSISYGGTWGEWSVKVLKQVCSLPCAGALLRYCTSVWLVLTSSAGRVSVLSELFSGKPRAVIVLTLPVGSNKTCKVFFGCRRNFLCEGLGSAEWSTKQYVSNF